MVFRSHRASKIDGSAGHVGVHVHATRKYNQTTGVDGSPSCYGLDQPAAIIDVKVLDFAINPVGGVVNSSTHNSEHEVPYSANRLRFDSGP